MPDFVANPRDSQAAQLTRITEPYAFQRHRDAMHSSYPRPAQPNTSQPNQIFSRAGWGMSTQDYWQGVFDDYLKRKRES